MMATTFGKLLYDLARLTSLGLNIEGARYWM